MDLDFKKLKQIDPLHPQEEVDFDAQKGSSPFDPPDAYAQPIKNGVAVEDMHPYLRALAQEHTELTAQLDRLDALVVSIRSEGTINEESFAALSEFFRYFETDVIDHNRREERELFPLLRQRMLERGEHSTGPKPVTPIAVMEKEHVEAIQISSVAKGFCALAHRLQDPASRTAVLGIGLERCEALTEMMRLHIFREDRIVFVLAQEFLTLDELETIAAAA